MLSLVMDINTCRKEMSKSKKNQLSVFFYKPLTRRQGMFSVIYCSSCVVLGKKRGGETAKLYVQKKKKKVRAVSQDLHET